MKDTIYRADAIKAVKAYRTMKDAIEQIASIYEEPKGGDSE